MSFLRRKVDHRLEWFSDPHLPSSPRTLAKAAIQHRGASEGLLMQAFHGIWSNSVKSLQ